MPRVSVLMPVYNAGQYLAQAIDSIVSQTLKDWELILINDGSTDDSDTIISRYKDSRIYYVKNETNLGLIKTLNKGIDYCGGKYIARMDADDISHPDRLKLQVSFLDNHPDHVLCGTDATVVDATGMQTGKIRNLCHNEALQINLLFSPPFIHPSVMIRSDVLRNNKYDEAYKHVEDYELWTRITKVGKLANIGKDLLKYRWHDSNVSVLNGEVQNALKDRVIERQLEQLDVQANKEDLYNHNITFRLYQLGNKQDVADVSKENVSVWFSRIIQQNKLKQIYRQSELIAFLWSRWVVLCISQKKYAKALTPGFATFNLAVLKRLFKLIFFLRKKQ